MSTKPFAATLATLLIIVLVAPATFFIMPQRASADGVTSCIGGLLSLSGVTSVLGVPIQNFGISAATASTAGSTAGDCINNMILKPLARSLIHSILQQITASTINWITGRSNGTGQPSFVLNLSLHLQSVGDAVALPFINQVKTALNPMFGAAIASSLLSNYARQTSIGGFLAGNQSTLAQVSPNPAAFAAGDISQGGIPAWFKLTTEDNNNPYMLELASKAQLGNVVTQAKTNRVQDLTQSRGYVSWCGASNNTSGGNGINPGASCINKDGTSGNIQTPGTVIQGYAQQVLGADVAQLINPTDIDASLAAIFSAAVQQGISTIFGGTGLFGASQPSSVRPTTITNALQTTATNNVTAINAATTAANTANANVQAYTTAWNTVASAASSAQSNVTSLKNNAACASQSSAADTALSQINAVLAQAQAATATASATQTYALQVQSEATSNAATLSADTATLAAMTPQAADVATAQAQAAVTGGASASPTGSLTVSSGTLVDQMNLISGNALLLNANNCAAVTTATTTP